MASAGEGNFYTMLRPIVELNQTACKKSTVEYKPFVIIYEMLSSVYVRKVYLPSVFPLTPGHLSPRIVLKKKKADARRLAGMLARERYGYYWN